MCARCPGTAATLNDFSTTGVIAARLEAGFRYRVSQARRLPGFLGRASEGDSDRFPHLGAEPGVDTKGFALFGSVELCLAGAAERIHLFEHGE